MIMMGVDRSATSYVQGKTGDLICQYEGLVEHDGIVR